MEKQTIGSFEAKTHFAQILQKVSEENIEYTITRRGVPVATIIPYVKKNAKKDIKKILKDFAEYRDKYITPRNKNKDNPDFKAWAHEGRKY